MRANSQREARYYLGLARKHAEHCLTRDQDNQYAKLIKAQLLFVEERFEQAYEVFSELFEQNPLLYESLTRINTRLGREEKNLSIYDQAQAKFELQLADPGLSIDEWSRALQHVMRCLVEKEDFETAQKKLEDEIGLLDDVEYAELKRVFIQKMLAAVYLDWIRSLEPKSDSTMNVSSGEMDAFLPQQLEMLKKAYGYDPGNADVLRGLTRIALSDQPLAEEARAFYDPRKHRDAPASVLNELGSDALSKSQYEDAIRYFELARKKAPNNSMILNNLAYVYLVCGNRNPERALKLVDEAIRFLPNNETALKVRSNFFDTRGTALMQLNRMDEAVAAFEIALQDRPNNRKILESLVRCYQGNSLSPEVYLERLRRLDAAEAAKQNGDQSSNRPSGN